VLEHTLSEDEHNQIVQTIEMFEAITQTQPDDCGSLEILKEAYGKIGKHDDSLRVSRRLAEAYFGAGSYTLATGAATGLIDKANTSIGDGSLIDIGSRNGDSGKQSNLNDRGDDHLAKFLIVQQLFSEEEVSAALLSVQQFNKDLSGQALAVSLLDHLCKDNVDRLEAVLSALIDRTKFAYVPLEYYDLDRQIAPMLPEHLTLGRMFVPFDLVSRTMMVACCNPFDSAGREAVQQSVDYTVTWYLARPVALIKSLQSIYRLDSRA
jgi:Type II secretion system (T2SS), protein E, N-terminal domain